MRLTPTQVDVIRSTTAEMFGNKSGIWLFGSRVDDTKRGGDIDLYVESPRGNTFLTALRCKLALEDRLDLHVDLVVREPGKSKPIYELAKAQGVRL